MAIEGKAKVGRSLAKDFHRLMKNIASFSGGQARLASWDETDLKKGITVAIVPDNGLYKDGEFMFLIACNNRYPERAPDVYCKTFVYHPNIDTIDGDGEICLNMLDDECWSSSMTLEDVVQGILFLMHNPNLEDPLSVIFSPHMDEEEFADNVKQSLDGGLVEGYHFERNRVAREGGREIFKNGSGTESGETVCHEEQPSRMVREKEDAKSAVVVAENKSTDERKKMGTGEKEGEGERGVIGVG